MKASESIRLLVDKANRDLAYKAPEIRDSYLLNVLDRVIALIATQEQAEAWVPFAERMPEPPVKGDKRVLLVNDGDNIFIFNNNNGKWLDDDGEDLSAYGTRWQAIYWRYVNTVIQ